MTSIPSTVATEPGAGRALPLPGRHAKPPEGRRRYTNSELLAMAELHLVLGTTDEVAANVHQMVGVYQSIVQVWLRPHLHGGDQEKSCQGCDGEVTYAQCSQAGLFRELLTEYAPDLPIQEHSTSELLRAAEERLTRSTSSAVSPETRRMVGLYRRVVKMWLQPHLRGGDPPDPCEGCGGQYTHAECPHTEFFRQMLHDFASNLLEAR